MSEVPAPAPSETVWSLEKRASRRGERGYVDPDTGFMVFTSFGHRARGACCGRACRHCPFAHEQVPLTDRWQSAIQPSWISPAPDAPITLVLYAAEVERLPDEGWLLPLLLPQRTVASAVTGKAPASSLHDSTALIVPMPPQRPFTVVARAALALLPAGSTLKVPAAARSHPGPTGIGPIDWLDPALAAAAPQLTVLAI